MKQIRRPVALMLAGFAALSLTACGGAGSSVATGETAEIAEAAAESYTGPLYQVSLVNVRENGAPDFSELSTGEPGQYLGYYKGIVLWKNFRENDTFRIWSDYQDGAYESKFCDADLQELPLTGKLTLMTGYQGYRMFWRTQEDGSKVVEVYDPDLNLITTVGGEYKYSDMLENTSYNYLKYGWMPVQQTATGLYGFLNVYTGEWHPLPEGCTVAGAGMTGSSGLTFMANSFYSDGLAYVAKEELARIYNPGTSAQYGDREIVGFLDEEGNFAFRFDEIDDFAGKLVVDVTGFQDGTCMVAGREDDGIRYGETRDGQYGGLDLDFFYQIDKTGHVVRQVDYDTYSEFRDQVRNDFSIFGASSGEYELYQADSLQLADGLTLRVINPPTDHDVLSAYDAGGYALVDANGNSYPLGDQHIIRVMVGDDGTVLLECNDDYRSSLRSESMDSSESTSDWYRLQYQWIAPESYVLPEGQQKDLSAEGLPTVQEYRNQQQLIWLYDANLEGRNNLTYTFTCPDFSSSYQVQEEDYDIISWTDGESKEIDMQFVTLSDAEFQISSQWTDSEGKTHYAKEENGMFVETEGPATAESAASGF